ncbi:MAG: AIR carboxylase family protein, partial [Pseudomonadota bacterium]|nr:AIR carboxylase family protein [Pseudomonadota bacterium]
MAANRKSKQPKERQSGKKAAVVGIIMGSQSDWSTMKHAADVLETLDVQFEAKVVSAHRTPDR